MKQIDVQVILFDLDGVIIDSREAISNCVNFSLGELGLPVREKEEIYQYIGMPLYDIFKILLPSDKQNLLPECIRLYRQRYEKKSAEETKLVEGIQELLEKFKNKTIVVATTKPTLFAEKLLTGFNLRNYFSRVFGSELLGRESDKTEIVRKILNEIKANSAVIIGDRKYDIEAGKENNIFTIGVTWGIGGEKEIREAKPDFIVNEPREIEDVVK